MSKLIHSAAVSLFLSLVLVSPGSSVFGQSSLPPCLPSGYFHLFYGTYTFANGDRYVGEYRDDKRNGQGTLIWSDGTRAAGIWSNDIFVGASNANSPSVAPSSSARVKLSGNGGTFTALILVNERLPLNFTIDSGASDVSIPADVLLTLRRIGTIQDDDFRGFETYSLADGSTVKHPTFILRSLTIGGVTVRNVLASITDVKGSPLLGQSFLKRLRSWSIDNTTNELVLVP